MNPADLIPGDQFEMLVASYGCKPKPRVYTVRGHFERNGIHYLEVQSDFQGIGSMSYEYASDVTLVER